MTGAVLFGRFFYCKVVFCGTVNVVVEGGTHGVASVDKEAEQADMGYLLTGYHAPCDLT